MDFHRAELEKYLLSENNITFITKNLMEQHKINQKSYKKCRNMVTKNLRSYIGSIKEYPSNKEELIQAVSFLNSKCYHDFEEYLASKFPNNQKTINNPPPEEEMSIITEEEKEELLRRYGSSTDQGVVNGNDFLTYLTNPKVIEMFHLMTQKLNQNVTSQNKYDQIIDSQEAIKMMQSKSTVKEDEESDDEIEIDLDNLNTESLLLVEKRVGEIVKLVKKHKDRGEIDEVNELEEERKLIVDAIMRYRSSHEPKKVKTEKLEITPQKNNENSEILDLELDASKNPADLKDIKIKFVSDHEVHEIYLTGYYIPYNPNCVTRFNNKFAVYLENRLRIIYIPPGSYSIKKLLGWIEKELPLINFDINDQNIITINSTKGEKFDLMIDDETIFAALGFTESADKYKNKICYEASKSFNLNAHQKVLFTFAGATRDPFELEFDKKVILDEPILLKRLPVHIPMKQMHIRLLDELGSIYDFELPFNISLKLNYHKF